ncbi:MAG TPA: glycerol-3-phosphate dehydrogenase/oxidase [Spirochaetota bacterium]|nr:glycerol-3-phosphate dehydrogenase/oxidase [Spirochaetota bacterium]HPP49657.1 glycerol-3-phosphate dehydrogenase/oxidase [Spirochaetota bacterium]
MKRFIEENTKEQFDCIIVGGGITGAAVAYEAASRGLTVALLEKNDFGWATSAATSKLIHGGLRYLNYFEFGLVRESLRERRILENIAPNLVYPFPFMIPNYNRLENNRWVLKIGMILYDILSYDKGFTWDKSKKIPMHFTLSKEKALQEEPNIRPEGLTAATVYYDCQSIFPERLTLAFIKSAVQYGAKVANYAEVVNFVYTNNSITGVIVHDKLTGREVTINGNLIINCGGPWADIILKKAENGKTKHQIRRSEGIHIITKPMVNTYAVGLMPRKGRHFFLIPWRGYSLIGTTDKEYIGNPDEYTVTKQSIQELLDDVNSAFGDGNLTFKDIRFAYGGLRPLVEDQVEGTYQSSRRYEIYDNAEEGVNGLITVEGGKYTTSRNLAVNVMKLVEKKIQRKLPPSVTHTQYLAGCTIKDLEAFFNTVYNSYPSFNKNTLTVLVKYYGSELDALMSIANSNKKYREIVTHDGEILAEVIYAIRHEMARTLSDIVFRRTGICTAGNPGNDVLNLVAETAAKELKWDEKELKRQLKSVQQRLQLPK